MDSRRLVDTVTAWVQWVDSLPSSAAIRESTVWYPTLLTVHLVSMSVFAGLILLMDLRLFGVGDRSVRFSDVQKNLFPMQMASMAVSAVSGLALVYGQPTRFYLNVFFWIKMSMIGLAGLNAVFFHYTTYRSISAWDAHSLMPWRAKAAALVSMVLWACVIVAGRLIAYNWFDVR